ncbi:MAG: murein biosynthesis integral membrane protein MurJ [Gammaproteobacteria bacterium]|nr:murein biosynthesis integral membrane protein MurJ [Gammaproteobacteria bacterium]MDE0247971.1 murein biosynthesis integral membrane protein MurJ [Gammaproteobacteria bacterium]
MGGAGRSGASLRVGAGILLSRIAGLVRERVFAHYFGASPFADAWRAALRMPNVLQNLLAEGTLSASFIPVYAELVEAGRDKEAARFAGAVFGLLTVAAGVLAGAGIVLAPVLVAVFFGGFDPDRYLLTVDIVRILFPMTALLVISAWALGILNTHRRFFLPYVAPVGWNGAIIGAMWIGGAGFDLSGDALVRMLAWGALVGGGVQCGLQLPLALRLLGEFRPSISPDVHGVREAVRNWLPVVASRGVVNLGSWLDFTLAAYLATGAVATLGYAQTLYLLPIALFGMSVAASELPELARGRGRGIAQLGEEVTGGMRRVAYFLIPSALGYISIGHVITAAIYQTGAFGEAEVRVTWAVLAAYAIGMPASALSRLLSSAFFAVRNTRTPARVAYLRVALSLAVGGALMFPLDSVAVEELRLGAAGLALGASVAAWVEYFLLRRYLRRTLGPFGIGAGHLFRMGTGALAASVVGLLLAGLLPFGAPWLRALGTLAPFGGVYLLLTALIGVRPPLGAQIFRRTTGG